MIRENGADFVAMSALFTTTMPQMKIFIAALDEQGRLLTRNAVHINCQLVTAAWIRYSIYKGLFAMITTTDFYRTLLGWHSN